MVLFLVCGSVVAGGCGDDSSQNQINQGGSNMQAVQNAYGYGLRDAKAAFFDMQPMWTWFKSEPYRRHYARGWKDGRHLRELNESNQ